MDPPVDSDNEHDNIVQKQIVKQQFKYKLHATDSEIQGRKIKTNGSHTTAFTFSTHY